MDNNTRRIRISELKSLQDELRKLTLTCPHELIPFGHIYHGYGGDVQDAKCTICEQTFRWYCEKSPSKKCEYNHSDFCIYCGRGYDLPK